MKNLINTRTKAGLRRSWPLFLGAILVGILAFVCTAQQVEGAWSLWLLSVVTVMVGGWAGFWGYSTGPFRYQSDSFRRIESHFFTLDDEIVEVIDEQAKQLAMLFTEHGKRNTYGSYFIYSRLLKVLRTYTFVVADLHEGAGRHYYSRRRIEIDRRHQDEETIRWEIGHALMYALVDMGEIPSPSLNARKREEQWLKYRQLHDLM